MKNTSRKLFTMLLVLVLSLSLAFSVYAADTMPGGDEQAPSGQMDTSGGTPPDKPDGETSGGSLGAAPGGESGNGAPGGSSSGVDSYDAVTDISEDTTIENETIESTGTDENAIHVSGGTTVITGSTITRDSDDSTGGDNSSFYGVGAAVLTTDGTTYISDSTITTDAAGGAGVFAYGDGTVYVADTTISTSEDTSGGIHAAGGGTLYAYDVTATTEGESSAAIRSDRGGGTMVVDGGSYTSNGTGSPAVYCTADISVNDAELTANGSEAVCIEGLNSLALYDCDLTGDMPENEQNDCTWTVILYQSMSGDSEVGCSSYNMQGGTLVSKNGGLFYTTNTESSFYIEDVDITASDDCEFFLKCTGNSNARGWGSTGSNGADCVFTIASQEADGDIIWDSISQLDFYMTENSTLTGAVLDDESNAGNGGDGYCSLYIEEGSTWVVTGDSTLTHLYNAGTIVDENGKTVKIVDEDGNVLVSGDSSVTVTVTDYSEAVDLSGMSEASSWEDVSVARPELLGTAKTSEETVTEDTDIAEETEDAAETENTETKSDFPTAYIIGGIVVIAAAVVLILRKKKQVK